MKIIEIAITSTSDVTADATRVIIGNVIRENETFRYIFCPTLVDNRDNPSACVKGAIIVQRKSSKENWNDCNTLHINNLKVGEWGKLELNSESILALITYSDVLREIYNKDGNIKSMLNKNKIIIIDSDITNEDKDNMLKIQKENPNFFKQLCSLMDLKVNLNSIIEFIENNESNVENVAKEITIEKAMELYDNLKLRFITIEEMKDNLDNPREEFWQQYFQNNEHILSLIIPNVFQIIASKAYVGGKGIDNKGGTVVDFIYNSGINNIALIEIKTPVTDLLSTTEYRDGVYSMSKELAGAIAQVKDQKDHMIKEYNNISKNSGNEFAAYDPNCYIIIGNIKSLDNDDKIRSYELIKSSLKDITVITFDELITKVNFIINLIKSR